MLSVAKLALGQEAYYEQQVALGLADSLEHLVPERRAQAGGRFGDWRVAECRTLRKDAPPGHSRGA